MFTYFRGKKQSLSLVENISGLQRWIEADKSDYNARLRVMNQQLLKGVLHSVPEDMDITLNSMQQLVEIWNKLTPIQRNEWICWVTSVKKSETRVAHILRLTEELTEGKRIPCCWPGCPHRKDVNL